MEAILVISIFIVLLVLVIYLRLNQAKIIGRFGEKRVSLILNSLPDNYYSFNDIYIRKDDVSVQIDHVIISVYGIFVIETKNYTGWIYGSDKSEKWVKNMYGNKYYFQNPLKQNYSHVKALQDVLGISMDKFIPVVVFLKGATLKCDTKGLVVYSSKLKSLINSYTTPILDVMEVERLVNLLFSLNVIDKKVKKEHVKNIHQKLNRKKNLIDNHICPKCGGQLVERKGRYGKFWGCSNYPRCKFTL